MIHIFFAVASLPLADILKAPKNSTKLISYSFDFHCDSTNIRHEGQIFIFVVFYRNFDRKLGSLIDPMSKKSKLIFSLQNEATADCSKVPDDFNIAVSHSGVLASIF
jgi:hypothetical protein